MKSRPTIKRYSLAIFAACIVVPALSNSPSISAEKSRWQKGRLISAALTGYGKNPEAADTKHGAKSDIWWAYCVSSGGKAYSAVTRTSPDKAGLTVDRPVQFSIDRDKMQILNPKGTRIPMRVVREGDESICH